MNCINCGKRTSVYDSRSWRKGVLRRRRCVSCDHVFGTVELLQASTKYAKYKIKHTHRHNMKVALVVNGRGEELD